MKASEFRRAALYGVMMLLLILGLAACPPPAHVEEALTAEVVVETQTIRTLDAIVIEVHVEDADGHHHTDMTELHLEVRLVGSDTWTEITLTVDGEHYSGTTTFTSSGDYEIRVTGMAHSGHEMEEMFSGSMLVERAHADVGLYHIQYESDPGHIHEGDPAILNFWIALDDSGDPVLGLAAEIFAEDSLGAIATVNAAEGEGGLYWAEITFSEAGSGHAGIRFTAPDNSPIEADFHIDVAHGH